MAAAKVHEQNQSSNRLLLALGWPADSTLYAGSDCQAADHADKD